MDLRGPGEAGNGAVAPRPRLSEGLGPAETGIVLAFGIEIGGRAARGRGRRPQPTVEDPDALPGGQVKVGIAHHQLPGTGFGKGEG